jgi:hypothetical protein
MGAEWMRHEDERMPITSLRAHANHRRALLQRSDAQSSADPRPVKGPIKPIKKCAGKT